MKGKKSVVCPRCKSYSWDGLRREKKVDNNYPLRCLRCGYEWASPKEAPKSCPRCRSRVWNEEKVAYLEKICLECGYKWTSKYEYSPVCPACHSPKWNVAPPILPKTDELFPANESPEQEFITGGDGTKIPNPNYKKPEEPSEETSETTQTEDEHYIMKSIEAKLGTSEARGEHQAITEKEEHWVEVKSSVILGVEGKRETRIVNKDEMQKLTGK